MVTVPVGSDEDALLNQCLLDNSATRGENAALRQALQVNVEASNTLFGRLLEVEHEQPWLADALRRAELRSFELETQLVELAEELEALRSVERRCSELETQLADSRGQLDALYQTKTLRMVRPVRRVWGVVLRVVGPGR